MKDVLKQFKIIKTLLAFMMLLMVVGCIGNKNTTKTLYASLDAATSTYNAAYDLVTTLGEEDKINTEQKIKIKAVMIKTEAAIKSASDVLDLYVKTSSESDKLDFETNILTINQLVIEITKIIGGTL